MNPCLSLYDQMIKRIMALTLLTEIRNTFRKSDASVFYVLAAIIVLIALLIGFTAIADEVMEGGTHQMDIGILKLFRHAHDLHTPIGPVWMMVAARDLTALGSHAVLTFITVGAAIHCGIIRRFGTMLLILAASMGAAALSASFKSLFGRVRPDIVPHLVEVSTLSFPSGHAMLSASIYLSLGAIIAQNAPDRRSKIFIISTALVLTGLIGLSRIYLGVHYPSDVIAGWMAGLAWAICCWLAAFHFQCHAQRKAAGKRRKR